VLTATGGGRDLIWPRLDWRLRPLRAVRLFAPHDWDQLAAVIDRTFKIGDVDFLLVPTWVRVAYVERCSVPFFIAAPNPTL
jgi:hypothetical protein